MAKWLKMKRDADYTHKSRAVTAYKAGTTVYAPEHIAEKLIAEGAAEETDKPDKHDRVTLRNDKQLTERIADDG